MKLVDSYFYICNVASAGRLIARCSDHLATRGTEECSDVKELFINHAQLASSVPITS